MVLLGVTINPDGNLVRAVLDQDRFPLDIAAKDSETTT
jgi:hypothetical protein